MLIIMDGWGHGLVPSSDAIANAKTPFVSSLYNKYPNTELITCGEAVGLPEGQMGNSEVGHLNIGAGRIVYQELQRINVAVREGELAESPVLKTAFDIAKSENKTLHFMGLLSDGGVHSHINHLKSLCSLAQKNGIARVAIHVFTDGRDTDPKSGLGYLEELQQHLNQSGGFIATVIGRYYAMDRDKRWERVKLAYDALTNGVGVKATDAIEAIKLSYEEGVTDEFIKPIIITCGGNMDVFFEPIMNKKQLFIFGAGHSGNALIQLATDFDFDITIIDDRKDSIEGILNTDVKKICSSYQDAFQQLKFDEQTFVCILTYSHAVDHLVLAHCIHQPHSYLGMMGSLRKVLMTKQKFIEEGFANEAELNNVDMPMGIDINAEGPEEIAISILAKMISIKNKTSIK